MPFGTILRKFFVNGVWTIEEGLSGWNNTTRFVEAEGLRWVLRVYETHKDIAKIRYEHEILISLNELRLPFRVPMPVNSIDGHTLVTLDDGTERLACLFTYIEGRRPDESSSGLLAYDYGVATGQLSKALEELKVSSEPVYPPYYEMDSAHPLCTSEKVAAFCKSPPSELEGEASALRVIGTAIQNFRAYLPQFRTLPHQLIHGDINLSNSLVREEDLRQLEAILDFEFCTWDLRVMEVAVVVSGFLSDGSAIENIDRYLEGVGSQLNLEQAEIAAIPLLVQLRILDVFHHFLGRYLDGVDGAEVLREQAISVYEGLLELENISDKLQDLCIQHLSK